MLNWHILLPAKSSSNALHNLKNEKKECQVTHTVKRRLATEPTANQPIPGLLPSYETNLQHTYLNRLLSTTSEDKVFTNVMASLTTKTKRYVGIRIEQFPELYAPPSQTFLCSWSP